MFCFGFVLVVSFFCVFGWTWFDMVLLFLCWSDFYCCIFFVYCCIVCIVFLVLCCIVLYCFVCFCFCELFVVCVGRLFAVPNSLVYHTLHLSNRLHFLRFRGAPVLEQGQSLGRQEEHTAKLWLVHKTRGELVTRQDPQGRRTIFDRLAKLKLSDTLMPVVSIPRPKTNRSVVGIMYCNTFFYICRLVFMRRMRCMRLSLIHI